jgi:acetyltransferase-like isoleucine patch superfamily enzyme
VLTGGGNIRIGHRFVIRGHVARCELTSEANSQLIIGDRVFLNQGVVVAAKESIEIGDDCLIGDFSAIYDSNYHQLDPSHPDKPRPVTIGKNVWLGNGVLVLPGSQIGDHTVVAARSVVKGTLPPRVLAAGNPAVVVRQLEIPDGWRRG